MNQTQLMYWLRGFVELHVGLPTAEQWDSIRREILASVEQPTFPVLPQRPPGDCGCKGKSDAH